MYRRPTSAVDHSAAELSPRQLPLDAMTSPGGNSADEITRPSADERERLMDEREAALDEREMRLAGREAQIAARTDAANAVLTDAGIRDARADERDAVAEGREWAASLHAFLHPNADLYEAAIKARRYSALDRSRAKSDRSSSADDRSKLSGG